MSVRTVSVYRQGIGANQALYAIPVRAQIDGHLPTVDFVEGQDLCKGEALARVDPAVYQTQYNQARRLPRRLKAKAMLVLSKVEFHLVPGFQMPRSSTARLHHRYPWTDVKQAAILPLPSSVGAFEHRIGVNEERTAVISSDGPLIHGRLRLCAAIAQKRSFAGRSSE